MTEQRPSQHPKLSVELWDGFPLVVKKTECGLQSCKDILQFYKKRAQIEEEYSKALVKLCISATSEKRIIFKGRGNNSVIAESPSIIHSWETVIASTERAAKIHGETAKKINDQCAEPVGSFIKDMEKSQKQVVVEGTRLTKELDDILQMMEKAKQNYMKACVDNEMAEKAEKEAKSDPSKSKDLSKITGRVTTCQEKVKQTEKEYREKLECANAIQDKLHKDQMPKVLDELEHWEEVRSKLIKSNMKKFIFAVERVPEVLKEAVEQMAKGIDVIDSQLDIERFIEDNKTYNVPPSNIEFENYVPGVATEKQKFDLSELRSNLGSFAKKATQKSAEALSSAAGLSSNNASSSSSFSFITKEEKKGVFDVPLEEVMELQKDQPELELPRIVPCLTESVIALGGLKTEGIFRVPASASEVQILKKQFNTGNYDTSVINDVNVPAALLKLWLRSLPDPLVPNALYEQAINSISPEASVALFQKLPPLNSKVIKHLIQFLSTLAQPENVKYTRMGLENLAMVFAPSLVRCPSDDPLQILANAKLEQRFLKYLIEGLCPIDQNKPEEITNQPDSQQDEAS